MLKLQVPLLPFPPELVPELFAQLVIREEGPETLYQTCGTFPPLVGTPVPASVIVALKVALLPPPQPEDWFTRGV
jgi:hypothetical protein